MVLLIEELVCLMLKKSNALSLLEHSSSQHFKLHFICVAKGPKAENALSVLQKVASLNRVSCILIPSFLTYYFLAG